MAENAAKRFSISKIPEWLKLVCFTAGLIVVLFVVYIIFKPLYDVKFDGGRSSSLGTVAHTVAFSGFVAVIIVGAIGAIRKTLTVEKTVALIFIAAMILRVGYMLVTPPNVRQYDTFVPAHNGHEGYAFYIYDNMALPENNGYQFYHPPLNAFIQAAFMRVTNALTELVSGVFGSNEYFLTSFNANKPGFMTEARYYLYGTCQILSVVYSFFTLYFGYKVLKVTGVNGKNLAFWFAFFAFFPRHIMFAATLNNDPLAYLNSLAAIYFALRWRAGGRKITDIVCCALLVGLGISAKLSAAVVCLPIGCVFAYEFIKSLVKKGEYTPIGKLMASFAIFLVICAPLSLWFTVYAKIKFDQPFGFVFDNLNKALSTDHHNLFERLFVTFDRNEWFYTFYLRTFTNNSTGVYNNFNMFNFATRSAIFGEFSYSGGEAFAATALISLISLTFVVALTIVLYIVAVIKDRKAGLSQAGFFTVGENVERSVFGAILFLSQMISYVVFYIKMPFSCTMDFRYIMPVIISIPLMLAGFNPDGRGRFYKIVGATLKINVAIFIACSTLFYLTAV